MPLPSINLTPKKILEEIRTDYARYEAGIFDQRETEKDIALLFTKLKVYGTDCPPNVLQSAEEILTKIKNEPAPNGIFDKLRQIFLDWRGKSETFEKVQPSQMTDEELKRLHKDSELSTLGDDHHLCLGGLSSPYHDDYALDKAAELGLKLYHMPKSSSCNSENVSDWKIDVNSLYKNHFFNDKLDLSVTLWVDQKDKEIRVIFGGVGADSEIRYPCSEIRSNRSSEILYYLTCYLHLIARALGLRHRDLEEAAKFVERVVKAAQTMESLKDYEVITSGHSKGSAEAVYAALAQPKPLRAICFASSDLSGALIRKLPKANVARAKDLITHYHIKGDSIPNLRYKVPSLRPLGKERVIIPPRIEDLPPKILCQNGDNIRILNFDRDRQTPHRSYSYFINFLTPHRLRDGNMKYFLCFEDPYPINPQTLDALIPTLNQESPYFENGLPNHDTQ